MYVSENTATYTALAPIYDRVMAHVRYDQWVELIQRVVKRYQPREQPRILEIGGGTGMLAGRLRDAGFSCTASDRSYAMCRQAHGRSVAAVCTDGRRLPFKPRYGLVLFLYDGINYLQSPREYGELFAAVHGCLQPRGLFLFDITTRANSLRYFSDLVDFEDFGDHAYVRHSYFDPGSSIQHNHFTIFSAAAACPGHFVRSVEHHAQRLFAISAVRAMIPRRLFSIAGVWDGYSFDPARADSVRVHFLLRANGAS